MISIRSFIAEMQTRVGNVEQRVGNVEQRVTSLEKKVGGGSPPPQSQPYIFSAEKSEPISNQRTFTIKGRGFKPNESVTIYTNGLDRANNQQTSNQVAAQINADASGYISGSFTAFCNLRMSYEIWAVGKISGRTSNTPTLEC